MLNCKRCHSCHLCTSLCLHIGYSRGSYIFKNKETGSRLTVHSSHSWNIERSIVWTRNLAVRYMLSQCLQRHILGLLWECSLDFYSGHPLTPVCGGDFFLLGDCWNMVHPLRYCCRARWGVHSSLQQDDGSEFPFSFYDPGRDERDLWGHLVCPLPG